MTTLFKSIAVITCTLLISVATNAQNPYLKSNETTLFGFTTVNGKKLVLALDKSRQYIVYRYGSAQKVEFEYPTAYAGSFDQFKRFHYARYGGYQNDATEINQLTFNNNGFTYKIYDVWSALKEGDTYEVGIIVEDSKTHKSTEIKGLIRTKKGSLGALKNLKQIKLTDDSSGD